jgi:hypothetical protein
MSKSKHRKGQKQKSANRSNQIKQKNIAAFKKAVKQYEADRQVYANQISEHYAKQALNNIPIAEVEATTEEKHLATIEGLANNYHTNKGATMSSIISDSMYDNQ